MSTNCRIALEQPDGTYDAINVHFDGSPSSKVPILLNYYKTRKRVKKLIEHGCASTIYRFLSFQEFKDAVLSKDYNPKDWHGALQLDVIRQFTEIVEKSLKDQKYPDKGYNHHVCEFNHRDEGDDFEIEKFENLKHLIKCRTPDGEYSLGVAFLYFMDLKGRWFAHYPYLRMEAQPIRKFRKYLIQHSKEKNLTW